MMRRTRVIGVRILAALGGGAALLLHAPPAHAPGYLAIGDQVLTGSLPRQLTFTDAIGGFAYSPDGKWIAYIAGKRGAWRGGASAPPPEPGATKLCLISPKGGYPIVLAALPAEKQDPPLLFSSAGIGSGPSIAWSANSEWVAASAMSRISSSDGRVTRRLLVVNVKTGETRFVLSGASIGWWEWHPTRSAIFLVDSTEIPKPPGSPETNLNYAYHLALIDLATGERKPIVELGGTGRVMAPRWTNGRTTLIFNTYYHPSRPFTDDEMRVRRITVHTESDTAVQEDLGSPNDYRPETPPRESPDGLWEVRFTEAGTEPMQLLIKEQGSEKTRVVSRGEGDWNVHMNWIAWSPDSTMFLFGKQTRLRDVATNTTHDFLLAFWVYQPAYGPNGHAAPVAFEDAGTGTMPDSYVTAPAWAPNSRAFAYLWGGALWTVELMSVQAPVEVLKAAGITLNREQVERLVLSNLNLVMQVATQYYQEVHLWPTETQIYQQFYAKDWQLSWNVFGDPQDPRSRLFVWLFPPQAPFPNYGPDAPHIPMCYIAFPPGRVCVVFFNSTEAMDQKDWDALVKQLKANKQWPPDW